MEVAWSTHLRLAHFCHKREPRESYCKGIQSLNMLDLLYL